MDLAELIAYNDDNGLEGMEENCVEKIRNLIEYYDFGANVNTLLEQFLTNDSDCFIVEEDHSYDYLNWIDLISFLRDARTNSAKVKMSFLKTDSAPKFKLEDRFVARLLQLAEAELFDVRKEVYRVKLHIKLEAGKPCRDDQLEKIHAFENRLAETSHKENRPNNAKLGRMASHILMYFKRFGLVDTLTKTKIYAFIYDYLSICGVIEDSSDEWDFRGSYAKEKRLKINDCLKAFRKSMDEELDLKQRNVIKDRKVRAQEILE